MPGRGYQAPGWGVEEAMAQPKGRAFISWGTAGRRPPLSAPRIGVLMGWEGRKEHHSSAQAAFIRKPLARSKPEGTRELAEQQDGW